MGRVQDHKRSAKAKRQVDSTTQASNKEDRFEIIGEVAECLPNTMFKIMITDSEVPQLKGKEVLGTLAGKMRLYRIRVMPGDIVKGYITKYDPKKAKITYRTMKKNLQ